MSNPPNNSNGPFDPPPPEKGPWLYSGANVPTPAYTPPPPPAPAPRPAAAASAATTPTPAKKTAAVKPAVDASKDDDNSLASIIDTIEAVVIALILALTFRAFIIEAFVIPTGSMAPTLLGAHFNVICPKCGYTFKRDASLRYQERNGKIDALDEHAELTSNTIIPADGPDGGGLVCPNCQYVIPYETLPQFLRREPVTSDDRGNHGNGGGPVPFAWANNGDRILVLKYIYSILEPKRYDVIVFKEPMYAQDNFIKRLIGLPGETIEIIGGDIFVGEPGDKELSIARKPDYVQRSVWQNVFDEDYYPIDEGVRRLVPEKNLPEYFAEWHNPWVGAGANAGAWNRKPLSTDPPGLKTVGGPVIHYTASAPGTLDFNPSHLDPYTYNILGYNNDIRELYVPDPGRLAPLLPVGDLRLETTWTPETAEGAWVSLGVGADRNRFEVIWSKDGLDVRHYDGAARKFVSVEKVSAGEVPVPVAGKTYNVAINNVDHAVQFFIDGKMVKEHLTPWTASQAHAEAEEVRESINNEPRSRIMEILAPHVDVSVGGACSLGHLKVFRDLYYTQSYPNGPSSRYPGAANERKDPTDKPFTLGPDEFFALGDNSRESHDGRTWNSVFPALDDLGTRRGIVPRRYLLGKAIFVYWPAGFQFSDKFSWLPPLVPNTGDMRFVR